MCGVLKCDPSRRAARARFVFRADRRHHRRAAVLARIVPVVPESGRPRGRGSRGVPNRVGRCRNLSSPLFSRITRRGARQFPTTLKGSPRRGIVEFFSFARRRCRCPAPRRPRRGASEPPPPTSRRKISMVGRVWAGSGARIAVDIGHGRRRRSGDPGVTCAGVGGREARSTTPWIDGRGGRRPRETNPEMKLDDSKRVRTARLLAHQSFVFRRN